MKREMISLVVVGMESVGDWVWVERNVGKEPRNVVSHWVWFGETWKSFVARDDIRKRMAWALWRGGRRGRRVREVGVVWRFGWRLGGCGCGICELNFGGAGGCREGELGFGRPSLAGDCMIWCGTFCSIFQFLYESSQTDTGDRGCEMEVEREELCETENHDGGPVTGEE